MSCNKKNKKRSHYLILDSKASNVSGGDRERSENTAIRPQEHGHFIGPTRNDEADKNKSRPHNRAVDGDRQLDNVTAATILLVGATAVHVSLSGWWAIDTIGIFASFQILDGS